MEEQPEKPSPPRSTYLAQKVTPPSPPQPQVFLTAEQMMEMIKQLRAPSDEEMERRAQEAERKKEHTRQSIQLAEQYLNNRLYLQQACNHRNERYHTFIAQNTADGNTVALCMICNRDYKWRTTADQARQGVNLIDFRGLTEATLLQWEKQFPPTGDPPDRKKLMTRAGKSAE